MKTLIPRNTLVSVVEIKDAVKQTNAGIIIPQGNKGVYRLCEIVGLGPGCSYNTAELSEMHDLKAGDTVLIKLADRVANKVGGHSLACVGLEYKDEAGRDLVLVEQTSIVAIVSDDGTAGGGLQDVSAVAGLITP